MSKLTISWIAKDSHFFVCNKNYIFRKNVFLKITKLIRTNLCITYTKHILYVSPFFACMNCTFWKYEINVCPMTMPIIRHLKWTLGKWLASVVNWIFQYLIKLKSIFIRTYLKINLTHKICKDCPVDFAQNQ